MKKFLNFIISLVLVFGAFSCSMSSFAKSPERIVSKPIGDPAIDIGAIIADLVTKEIVDDYYGAGTIDMPEHYTIDTSIYLLEYRVSEDYWNKVTSFDYNGLVENIDPKYPTIYIPVFGNITDLSGNTSNRVIAFVKLYYNGSCYKFTMAKYVIYFDTFINEEIVGTYEDIANYIKQSQTQAKQVFLIRYTSSFSENHDQIAVIQSENDTVILDISNTCKIETVEYNSYKPIAYSVEEYRSLRMEVEKTLYEKSWEYTPAEIFLKKVSRSFVFSLISFNISDNLFLS